MIPAAKSRFFTGWLSRDAESRVRRMFGRVSFGGLEHVREALASGPVLVVSNHSSWWDPIVLQVVCHRVLDADAFALMDAANLRRLPFFRKVGAFGVDLDDPADGARAVRHAVKLLDRPGRLVWIFPQGAERPLAQRPLGFLRASEQVARLARRAVTVPAVIHYAFGAEESPELAVVFGAPTSGDHERAVTGLLDAVAAGAGALDVYHRRAPRWWFRVAEKALAWLTS